MPTGQVSQTAVAALRLVPGRQAGVGAVVGEGVGVKVGEGVGPPVGSPVGLCVGDSVGTGVGCSVGVAVGTGVGLCVGAAEGAGVGVAVGAGVGTGSHCVPPAAPAVHWPSSQLRHWWYTPGVWYWPDGQCSQLVAPVRAT